MLAFGVGLLSALSLPLGALTTRFWSPDDKTLAWLMAFGAGALLSAVTIDLFAPAIQNGQFFSIAMGAIIGSLFYLILNNQLDQQGGFLRKTATLIQFLRAQKKIEQQQQAFSIQRLKLFEFLEPNDRKRFVALFQSRQYNANQILFHQGDPLNAFFIIQSGVVNLRKAALGLKVVQQLDEFDAFGHLGFLASFNSAFVAQAKNDTTVWVLNRADFNRLLAESPSFYQSVCRYFETSDEIDTYLQSEHHLLAEQVTSRKHELLSLLHRERRLMFNREPRDTYDAALSCLQTSRRFGLLDKVPAALNAVIAGKLKLRTVRAGETLFAHNSEADRLYLLDGGEVELIDPKKRTTSNEILHAGDYFGGLAFIVGGRHATTAVALQDSRYWVLDRADFAQILSHVPWLYEKLALYLRQHQIQDYLIHEQELPATKAERWVKQATRQLLPEALPSLESVNSRVYQHHAAYMAIWLGIFLDGIPESLMIGSHFADSGSISLSLIAAIFISNYPEALSSSTIMREQGIAFKNVLMAWIGLMVLTGLGAAIGSVLLVGASPELFSLISGMAAGAMLTVIAETMLPEAYAKGGSIIGFVTLMGFLAALLFQFLSV